MNRSAIRFYKVSAVVVLNTLVLLLTIELAASVLMKIVDLPATKKLISTITGQPNDLITYYQGLSYYADQEWSPLYWKEFKSALKKTYSPYVIWRSPAYKGSMLNIDPSGVRYTPAANCVSDAYKVYVFGGSSIWGWGAPDWGTIPAFLQSGLQAKLSQPVCVINYGENAYVSTQGLIHLILLLESGDVPDLVIFYDGVNDILAASQSGSPILHQNLVEISSLFDDPQPPIIQLFQNSNSFQLLQMIFSQLPISVDSQDPKPQYNPDQLSGQIAETYLNNYEIVSSLANTYQFKFYFFWQPYILTGNKQLSGEEHNMITGLNWVLNMEPPLVELFEKTYINIQSETPNYDHLYYLGDLFDQVEDQVWIDTWGHVTPEGNQAVTEEMLRIMK